MTRRYTGADEEAIRDEAGLPPFRPNMALIGYIGRSQRRRAGLLSAVPPTPQDELTRALRDYLYEMHAAGPREHSHWVMSLEWLNEVRKIDAGNVPAWLAYSTPETILGIPIEVRADGGAPHLEAAL